MMGSRQITNEIGEIHMGMIQGILSSVVIVALINLMTQNKTNKLKFITGERAKWRECLKKIAVEIEKADADTIKIPLAELKVNINSYGNYRNNEKILLVSPKMCELKKEDNNLIIDMKRK